MNIGDLIKDVEIYLDGQKDQYVDNDKSDHLYLFALDYNKFLDDFLIIEKQYLNICIILKIVRIKILKI